MPTRTSLVIDVLIQILVVEREPLVTTVVNTAPQLLRQIGRGQRFLTQTTYYLTQLCQLASLIKRARKKHVHVWGTRITSGAMTTDQRFPAPKPHRIDGLKLPTSFPHCHGPDNTNHRKLALIEAGNLLRGISVTITQSGILEHITRSNQDVIYRIH